MFQEDDEVEYQLRFGPYLGDISALCFLFHTLSAPLPYLLAGTGSQLLIYDLSLSEGSLIQSFRVFSGVRIHGISCHDTEPKVASLFSSPRAHCFDVAVFGERRVKLYRLRFKLDRQRDHCIPELDCTSSLPSFGHWVLDVAFLKPSEGGRCVAIGCSDNSVYVWDVLNNFFCLKVNHPDRCLLYSMRFWGCNFDEFRIASGTIFNEISIWKLAGVNSNQSLSNQSEVNGSVFNSSNVLSIQQPFEAVHVCKLVGHEGSVFRIAWSSDGSKVVSASDDRSSRIWFVNVSKEYYGNLDELTAKFVLYGHNARVWDCYISDSLIVTAGEDCTCRLWDFDGNQLKIIKEHTGRGVWRCVYDAETSLLISAGFDSAIKVQQFTALPRSVSKLGRVDDVEIITFQIPNALKKAKLMDSKTEYARSLHLRSHDALYVATNNGYLYYARFFENNDVYWTQLFQVSEGPIVCMDVISKEVSQPFSSSDDFVAIGDGKGNITIIGVIVSVDKPKVDFVLHWMAEKERQLLGIYWCKTLGHRFVFSSDPAGNVKLWQLFRPLDSLTNPNTVNGCLVAEFSSGFGFRIMCLAASIKEEVLVCGDLRGNIIVFRFSRSILQGVTNTSGSKVFPTAFFKGAHGISTITSVQITWLRSNETEIRSTGGDGCICFLEFSSDTQILEFVGMRQIKEMSLIQAVSPTENFSNDINCLGYAVGFLSTDFVIWNLMTETKVARITCGGWRRPYSFYLGEELDTHHCFAFLKDENIVIRKQWSPDNKRKHCLHNLQFQFHGREIHSLCFVRIGRECHLPVESAWIVTGCEDGTVRLTSYSDETKRWISSKLLGEHVSGSAVRSICLVSKTHNISRDSAMTNEMVNTADVTNDLVLLISAGAKGVITIWILKGDIPYKTERHDSKNNMFSDGIPSIQFKWLSSDIPVKCSVSKNSHRMKALTLREDDIAIGNKFSVRNLDRPEDYLRHLATTSFLVHCIGTRFSVCFIVVASSDATLNLRALVLPSRLWFDIASLVPLAAPVLTLQHIVIPSHQVFRADKKMSNFYLVVSGGTDGSIAFWDLSIEVETFVSYLLTLGAETLINHNRRPRTGRGSQGGRWWRCLHVKDTIAGNNSSLATINAKKSFSRIVGSNADTVNQIYDFARELETKSGDFLVKSTEIKPLHVLRTVHQSGVNCLHLLDIVNQKWFEDKLILNLVSGGDDQALHYFTFNVSLTTFNESIMVGSENQDLCEADDQVNSAHVRQSADQLNITMLHHEKVYSAHSSAVRGVWTNGKWVFSTGLDQRVRCWLRDEHGTLSEKSSIIVSVPEPEALDVKVSDSKKCYQIAVAGRGLQIVEFHDPVILPPAITRNPTLQTYVV